MTGLATEVLTPGVRARRRGWHPNRWRCSSRSAIRPDHGVGGRQRSQLARVGEIGEVLRWSQTIIDLAAGDPAKGAGFGVGSPLAVALAWRGIARWWLGRPGWRQDLHDAVAMARRSDPETLSGVVAWTDGSRSITGCFGPMTPWCARARMRCRPPKGPAAIASGLGRVHVGRRAAAIGTPGPTVGRGLELMMQARDIWLRKRALFLIPVADVWVARETARCGDRDAAIPVMRKPSTSCARQDDSVYGVWGTGVLVETLLERGTEGDLAEAEAAIERLAGAARR